MRSLVFSILSIKFDADPNSLTTSLYKVKAIVEQLIRLKTSSAKPSLTSGVVPFHRVPGGFRIGKLSNLINSNSMTKMNRKPDSGSPCGTPVRIGKNLLSLSFPVIIQLLRFASHFFYDFNELNREIEKS